MKKTAAALILLVIAPSALGHPQPGGGLLHGFVHPFTGLDHLAAMLIVGMWAARWRGAARLVLPSAFVGSMLAGALVARAGVFLPAVEPVVLTSIAVFAAGLAFRMRLAFAAVVVAAFGLFHGVAHITELPAQVPFDLFTAGMLAGTALLHALGLAIGLAVAAAKPRLA